MSKYVKIDTNQYIFKHFCVLDNKPGSVLDNKPGSSCTCQIEFQQKIGKFVKNMKY